MTNEILIAGLMALAMGLVKVLEKLAEWIFGKLAKEEDKAMVVKLDPDTSRMIRTIDERVYDLHTVATVRDQNGVPMVFSSRGVGEDVERSVHVLENVERMQEQTSDRLDRLDERLESVDRRTDEILKIVSR